MSKHKLKTILMMIDWTKLSELSELSEYLQDESFRDTVKKNIKICNSLPSESLDKLSKLRVLEITNGHVQYSYRNNDPHCLTKDQTKDCMNKVMGFMKYTYMEFPSLGEIEFTQAERDFIIPVRVLYIRGFKKQDPEARREFFAISTAIFIACGKHRFDKAFELITNDYKNLFTQRFIDLAKNYIYPYMECLI